MSTLDDTLAPETAGGSGLEGTTLGAYKIERLLGEGAMGEVFLANHVALGRPVAIKTLKPAVAADRALTERFFAEARAVNIIRHENIVECTDLVNNPSGRSYIVMELLEGKTLGGAIRDAGKIPARRAARIIAQIADAIGAAHDKGIVHRDLKPENVYLIRRAGSNDYVKVLDFGIARLRPDMGGASATQSGALIGTPAYMSPEQVRGEKVGPSADIYAVGVILFHMLTGRIPFEVASMSMMLVAQLQETPARVDKLVPEVPKAMADLVARALSKDAAGRPKDMAAFRREVLEAAGLPTDSGSSLIDSSPTLPRAVGSAEVSGVDATVLPDSVAAIGQSSISASAGQMLPPKSEKTKKTWLVAGAGVLAAGGIAAALFTVGPLAGKSETSEVTPPAIASAPPDAPVTPGELRVTTPALAATDARAAKDWRRLVDRLYDGSFADARKKLDEWDRRYGETQETRDLRKQLVALLGGDEDEPRPKNDEMTVEPVAEVTAKNPPAKDPPAKDPPAKDPPGRPPKTTAEELVVAANRAMSGGNVAAALADYKKAIQASPNLAAAWRGMGVAYARQGNTAQAKLAYERYLKLAPNAADAPAVRSILERFAGEQAKTDPPKTDPPKTDPPKTDPPKRDITKTLVDPNAPKPPPEPTP